MSYPSQFSSTLIYEAKYDLDKINVFLEGDGNNPMFFSVNHLPKLLSYGKHYFNISLLNATKNQQYRLKNNSKILFEFKSINGVILKSDIVKLNQRNGTALCYVEVLKDPMRTYKDVEDGEGTLILAASLVNTKHTAELIPKKFLDAMNYRCVFPIPLNSKHELSTTLGQFSFANGSISTRRNVDFGIKYDIGGSPENNPVPKGTTG